MKRITIVLIAIILLFSTSLNVYAADETAKVTLTSESETAKVGETITVTLSAKYDKGIEAVEGILEYDSTKLQLTKLEPQNHFASFSDTDDETKKFVISMLYGEIGAPEEAPKEAVFSIISFKVLEAAKENETLSIKLSDIEIMDSNLESDTTEDQDIEITVIADEQLGDEGAEDGAGDDDDNKDDSSDEGTGNDNNNDGSDDEGAGNDNTNNDGNGGAGAGDNDANNGGTGNGNEADNKEKDETTAKNPINKAGLKVSGLIATITIFAVIILYSKNKKYRDI